MSRTRDIIGEIAEVRGRRLYGQAMGELTSRLSQLDQAFKSLDKTGTELIRYFPVALIASIEGYFRLAIKELIDAGEPFLTNAERLAPSIKLDFMLVRAIHGKVITVGELMGHCVPLSHLRHIDSSMSSLIGDSFLDRMKTIADRWEHEVRGAPVEAILADPDSVFSGVTKTFELRHIICHEIASAHEITTSEVEHCFECCVSFLRAANELISETLYPNAPLTQADMNYAAGESLNGARKDLEVAFSELRTRLSAKEISALDGTQLAWEKYCTAWADFEAMQNEGGTIWTMIRAGAEESLVRNRTSELRACLAQHDSY